MKEEDLGSSDISLVMKTARFNLLLHHEWHLQEEILNDDGYSESVLCDSTISIMNKLTKAIEYYESPPK